MRSHLMVVFMVISVLWLLCLQGLAEEKLAVLHYDDGILEDGLWIGGSNGHAVLFTPPSDDWTLSKIAVYGQLNPQARQDLVTFEIWDKDLNMIYNETGDARSYFGDGMAWAEVDVPDVQMSEDFYVCFFESSNVYVGADLGAPCSLRSFLVSKEPNRIGPWELMYPREVTDWIISVLGSSPEPQADLHLSSDERGVVVSATITDEDSNLAGATMYVVDDLSHDVLWTEHRAIEGSKANLTFCWPRQLFQITNGADIVKPVSVWNTLGTAPEEIPYLTYSAPCLLKLTPEDPNLNALAYFGQDGEFHSLVDLTGATHYMSRELLKIVQPGVSYGSYNRNNITMDEKVATLSFFTQNDRGDMVTLPPLVLTRSPVQHYRLRMDEVEAGPGDYRIELYVEDSAGNMVRENIEDVSR